MPVRRAKIVFEGDGHASQFAGDLARINLGGTLYRIVTIKFVEGMNIAIEIFDAMKKLANRIHRSDLLVGNGVFK